MRKTTFFFHFRKFFQKAIAKENKIIFKEKLSKRKNHTRRPLREHDNFLLYLMRIKDLETKNEKLTMIRFTNITSYYERFERATRITDYLLIYLF